MPIVYEKLFLLIKERGRTEYYLRKNGISPSILDKLKHGRGGLDARTIEKLCRLLDCQPGDIMEYLEEQPEKE
ncbi:MAG: helix-turn-helix transcriptional regulator [Oscillospiraceae bacterium]|nr:helix-turn-helix transcriptional regulator [Oscillospiraceae bacterium]